MQKAISAHGNLLYILYLAVALFGIIIMDLRMPLWGLKFMANIKSIVAYDKSINEDHHVIMPGRSKITKIVKETMVKNNIIWQRKDIYQVKSGDTLSEIAVRFHVKIKEICTWNNISNPDQIYIGQKICLIKRKLPSRSYERRNIQAEVKKASWEKYFTYPTQGKLSSDFGMRWGRMHKGIDIASIENAPIYAFRQGDVIYAGWCMGYGLMVEIEHPNGLISRYAHCNKLYVQLGEKVEEKQCIALVGRTGNSSGFHLHFEVYDHQKLINPMILLE